MATPAPVLLVALATCVLPSFVSAANALHVGQAIPDDPEGAAPLPWVQTFDPRLAPLAPEALGPASIRVRGSRGTEVLFAQAGANPEGDAVSGVVFTPDGSQVLIAERESRNVVVWNADGTFHHAIDVTGSPAAIAVTPDGAHALVPGLFEDTVSILDLAAGVETAAIQVGDQPAVVAVNPSGTRAAVGNSVDGTISVLSLPSGVVERTIPGIGYVASLSVNFESGAIGFRVYPFAFADDDVLVHADFYNDRVLFVDTAAGTVVPVTVDDQPLTLALSGDRGTAVVAHVGNLQRVTVLDTGTQTVLKEVATGADLFGPITVDATGSKAVVAVQNACRVVDLVAETASPNIDTASVNELHSTSDGLYALGVGFRGALISYGSATLVKNLNNLVSCTYGDVSPTAARAAMAADTFGEDLLFLDTNGAGGFLDVATLSGPEAEGDKARIVAISPDGTRAAVSQLLSDNVGIHELPSGTLLGVVEAGDRPAEVAFSPDGSQVVVANLDSPFATVIDVASLTATNVGLSTRGSQVEISPDGHYAYVSVVANGDGVWRIDLETLTLAGSKILTGDMGGVGYLYNQTSGMTLSHDGSVLVVCGSFTDNVSFIDTASWTLLGSTVVGDFPVRALFSGDDSKLYVSCRDDDRIRVLDVATRSVVSTIVAGDWPFEMALSADESELFVLNFSSENVGRIDLELGAQVATIPLPNAPAGIALSADGSSLVVPTGTYTISLGPGPRVTIAAEGQLNIVDLESNAIGQQFDTGMPPSMLAYDGARAAVPSTFIDGFYLVELSDPAHVGGGGLERGPGMAAWPNPITDTVRLRYVLAEAAVVEVTIHDAGGRIVRTLVSSPRDAGIREETWDRRGDDGRLVEPGVYFIGCAAGAQTWAGKLVVR